MRGSELIPGFLDNHSCIGGQLRQPSLIPNRNEAGLLQRRTGTACLPKSDEVSGIQFNGC
jgi:hypothetical protein